MAAPVFVAASTGTTDATGPWTHTSAAPGAAGRILLVHVLQDGTTAGVPAITSVTNAEDLAGTNNVLTKIGQFDVGSPAAARHHVWIGRSLSTAPMVITGTNTGGDDVYVRVYEFSGVSTSTSLARVIENVTRGATVAETGTSATASDAAVTTLGPERLVVNLLAINDDNPVDGFTGQTGGTWAEAVAEYATQSGTDGCIQIQTATLATAGTINGGTASITDSDGWGVVGFALLPTGPAVYSGRSDVPITGNRVTNGIRKTASQVAFTATAGMVVAGRLPTRGVVSWANFTNPLPVSVKGIAGIDATWTSVTNGRSTFNRSSVAFPVGWNVTIVPELDLETYGGGNYGSGDYGDQLHTGVVSLELAVDVFTRAGAAETVSGAASLAVTAGAVSNGVRKTFGAVVAPETVEIVTVGQVGITEQVAFHATYVPVTAAAVSAMGKIVMPITADVVIRGTGGGTIAANTVLAVTFTSSAAGVVTHRSQIDFESSLIGTVDFHHTLRSNVSTVLATGVQTRGRLTARSRVAFPVTFTFTTGRVTQFSAVSFQVQFNSRTLKPTYNPPTTGYIAFTHRGRVRQGHEVVGV